MAMPDSATPPKFFHPLNWAPFVLAGEGGETLSRQRQRTARALGVVLLAAALMLSPAQAAEDPLAEASALQQQAATLYQQGRYGEVEPLLLRAIAELEQHFGPDDPKLAESLGYLADLYEIEGRYDAAEPVYRRVLAIREKAPGPDRLDLGAALNGLAGLFKLRGQYGEAEELYRHALDIVEKVAHPPDATVATILSNLALVYQNEGRYGDAEPLYRRAIAVADQAPGVDRQLLGPVVRNNLAGLYKEEHRWAEAEPLYKDVLQLRESGPTAPLDLAASLNNLASVYDAEGKYRDAEPLYQRALQIREQTFGPDHPDVAQSLNNLAGIYWTEGSYDEAEKLLQRALDIREKTAPPDHPERAAALNNLAALYWNEGKRAEALIRSRQAIAAVEAHLTANAGERSAAAVAEYRKSRAFFANHIGIAYGVIAEQPEQRATLVAETLRVAQLALASDTARAVAGMTVRFAAAGGSLANAIRERQDLAARWRRLDAGIVTLAARPEAERKPDEEAALRTQLANTRQALDAVERKMAVGFPDYAELADARPVPAADAQHLLAPDEALLVYLTTANETWFWALRGDAAELYRADLGAGALAAEIEKLRVPLTPNFDPYPATEALDLYLKLLAPAVPQLAGAHRLIVVPDGALQSLPFAILVTQRPEHDPKTLEDHRAVAWLARDYAVTILPAVSSLRALRQAGARQTASAPFLGIGDPFLAGDPGSARGPALARLFRGADAAEIRRLPALPETADELRAIAETLGAAPADLLLGERASEPVLRQTPLDHYQVIEFATHALLSGDLKGLAEPALVLTPPPEPTPDSDGLLTASKIAVLKLNADWVVLSACNTAVGDGTPDAGGWSGLAKAFFYAGARSLLVSHWPVWSKATVTLTTGIFAELAKDPTIGRAEALRRAEMAMLDPVEPPEFAHPLAWAPFILAGEGGEGR
jgi:CHAT domain-containing protein/Tfp pilus assembly protein PilF